MTAKKAKSPREGKKIARSASISVENNKRLIAMADKGKVSVSWLIERAIEGYLDAEG